MIIYEAYNENLTRAYSDAGMQIERDGVRYDEAIDPNGSGRTYTETDIPVESSDATVDDFVAALAELGIEEV